MAKPDLLSSELYCVVLKLLKDGYMRRREFVTLVGSAAAWPVVARAQRIERVPLVGVLLPLAETDPEQAARRAGLREALEKLGWSDGGNMRIQYRLAGGDADRFAPLAKEMVGLQPDVIFVQSTGFATAVRRETQTIPVVFTTIGEGFVTSLARPGGNFTGLTLFEAGIAGKWLSMLREIAPNLKRATLIINPRATSFDHFFRPTEAVGASLGVEITPSRVENPAEIERAIESFARAPGGGFVIAPGSTMLRNRNLIIALAARHRLPAVYPERIYALDGGLMSYGIADLIEPFRQAATYINRILRGEKPADLPVQGPTKYSTVLNLRTAKALGIAVPSGLLVAADEVIE
jgi:putative tryptophan/tyrosine transport system substrate-binding protein